MWVLVTTYVWILICELGSTTNFGSLRPRFFTLHLILIMRYLLQNWVFWFQLMPSGTLPPKHTFRLWTWCHPIRHLAIIIYFPSCYSLSQQVSHLQMVTVLHFLFGRILIGSTAAEVESLYIKPCGSPQINGLCFLAIYTELCCAADLHFSSV